MENLMQKKLNYLTIFSILLLLCVSCLYIYVGFFTHPYADDFSFSDVTHRVWIKTHSFPAVIREAVLQSKISYYEWQGSFLSIFIFLLNPIVFNYQLYWISALVLIILFCLSNFLVSYRLLHRVFRQTKQLAVTCACLLVSLQLICNRSPYEYFYNYISGSYYNFFNSLSLLAFALMLNGKEKQRWHLELFLLLLFLAIGAGNYITALHCFSILCFLILYHLLQKNYRQSLRFIFYLAALCVTLGISILSPGNAARQAVLDPSLPLHPLKAILLSGKEAAKILVKMCDFKMIGFLALLSFSMRQSISFPFHPLLLAGASFLCIAAQFTPILYGQGNVGPDRIYSLIYSNTIIVFYINLLYTALYVKHRLQWRLGRFAVLLAVLAIPLSILLPLKANVLNMLRDIKHNTLIQYHAQKMERHMQLSSAPRGSTVVLRQLQHYPLSLEGGEIEAGHSWINDSMAKYYDVQQILLGDE